MSVAASRPLCAGTSLDGEVQALQFLRFAAALMVVVYHAGIAARAHGFLGPEHDAWLDLSVIGASGVHIFFVISGFIMVHATRHSSRDAAAAGRFLYRRFARIFPVYWLYCGLYVAFHAAFLKPHALPPWEALGALLLWPGSSALIIGPGWTLSYELLFYLCFGACLPLGRRLSLKVLTGLLLAAVVAGCLLESRGAALQVVTSTLLLEFVAGMWIAVLVTRAATLPRLLAPAAIAAALVGFLASAVLGFPAIPTVLLWGVPSALLVLGMTLQERQGRTPRAVLRLSPLGNGSYSLYLLHNLLLDIVFLALAAVGAGSGYGGLWTALAVLASCLVAEYAYRFVEAPLLAGLTAMRRRPAGATG
ncbi:acyltransferase family protein [Methylorubrum populi]|uniref:Exopolysaccharide production protein ExoZ n=1 Tax=Methylorubrum populi TaxID=223967 RepID=A0A833J688_9HYPH|nr:acyltransferase [Methylorubrum populi]KAB7785393.1 Exopolysaccharide production protein ExoZ [Methylorubrum populi]